MSASYELRGPVAVITLNNPPVNGLGAETRQGLSRGLARAQADAEAMRFARGHLPLVNLWYAKTALDHAGLQAMQENLSPGYLARIQSKARKDWGQDYWWAPGQAEPARAPDLSAVTGE